ncbi:MAG TPA: response regulator [Thermoanaerobaculia bacterium]|jgi:DNA-binding response OmpR family regulator|nr:response regulator [Thermoanaerobaculia bacterium]
MRILIADDDRVLVTRLAAHLKSFGFEVRVAYDALAASTALFRESPDAIVLDIGMPAGTGMEVLRRLRSSAKATFVPVVVITGNEDPDLEEAARSQGAAEFFRKPIDVDRVREVLYRLLGSALVSRALA